MTKCVFDTFQSHERSGKVLISSDALAVWHISLTRIITSVVLRRIEQIVLYNVSAGATTRKNTGLGGGCFMEFTGLSGLIQVEVRPSFSAY